MLLNTNRNLFLLRISACLPLSVHFIAVQVVPSGYAVCIHKPREH